MRPPPRRNWFSAVAERLARWRCLPGRVRLLELLARAAGVQAAIVRKGCFSFEFDLADRYQVAMALDRYETPTARLFPLILKLGDCYIDVGAELGYFGFVAAGCIGPGGTMVFFEPDPRLGDRLQFNLATKPGEAAPAIIIEKKGCSDRVGRGWLRTAPILGQSAIIERGVDPPQADEPAVPVELARLADHPTFRPAAAIRLLKMDVEGHELWALRGAAELFAEGRIDYLIIEKNPHPMEQQGYKADHLHAFLDSFDYRGAHLDGRPVTRASMQGHEMCNFLYARSEALMRAVFPDFVPARESGWSTGELRDLADEARVADHPRIVLGRVARLAATGELAQALREAELILASQSELYDLRGHYAYWLTLAGRKAEAIAHYRILCEKGPEDCEARRRLEALTTGQRN